MRFSSLFKLKTENTSAFLDWFNKHKSETKIDIQEVPKNMCYGDIEDLSNQVYPEYLKYKPVKLESVQGLSSKTNSKPVEDNNTHENYKAIKIGMLKSQLSDYGVNHVRFKTLTYTNSQGTVEVLSPRMVSEIENPVTRQYFEALGYDAVQEVNKQFLAFRPTITLVNGKVSSIVFQK
jgi:hypothetical protein